MASVSAHLRHLSSQIKRAPKTALTRLKHLIPSRFSERITRSGSFDKSDLGRALDEAFRVAQRRGDGLPRWIIEMVGMSGRRYRALMNVMVRLVPRAVYMEVGSWSGSTAAAALSGNSCELICIDNWSQFGGPKEDFLANIERANTHGSRVQILETDFREVDFDALHPKANIYLFDGPHSESDQFDGIVMALPALQDRFLLVVDDYNWPQVRAGTRRALAFAGVEVEASICVRTDALGLGPTRLHQESDWHNGCLIAVVAKARSDKWVLAPSNSQASRGWGDGP